MKVEYSKRAVADLRKISADSVSFGEAVVEALKARIREIVAYISVHPKAPRQSSAGLGGG